MHFNCDYTIVMRGTDCVGRSCDIWGTSQQETLFKPHFPKMDACFDFFTAICFTVVECWLKFEPREPCMSHLLLVQLLHQPVQLLNVFVFSCVGAAQNAANACSKKLSSVLRLVIKQIKLMKQIW